MEVVVANSHCVREFGILSLGDQLTVKRTKLSLINKYTRSADCQSYKAFINQELHKISWLPNILINEFQFSNKYTKSNPTDTAYFWSSFNQQNLFDLA